jgi:hypothetical protein
MKVMLLLVIAIGIGIGITSYNDEWYGTKVMLFIITVELLTV